MKRTILSLLFAGLALAAFGQDAVKSRIDGLGVKKYVVKEAPTKEIKQLYLFTDGKVKGGVAVYTSLELRVDVYIVIVQKGDSWTVNSVGMVDSRYEKSERGGQVKAAYDRMAGASQAKMPDVISGATRHSAGIEKEVQYIFGKAVPLIASGA